MKNPIIDPRVKRLALDANQNTSVGAKENWETFEVFHQRKRGDQTVHVGIVHAPDAELAIVFAKEQFARRQKTATVWVVRTSDVYALPPEDEDMFETTPEKMYREAGGYKVRDKVNQYKKQHPAQ
jgi:ring-1,2-phenylacetyl-CoA epoxidase subunit PaaB